MLAAGMRQIAVHQSLMAYSFALLFTAPALRLLWLAFGVGRDTTQELTNLLGGIASGFLILVGAIVACRYSDARSAVAAWAPRLPGAWLDCAVWTVSGLCVVAIALLYRTEIGATDPMLVVLIVCYIEVLVGFVWARTCATRSGQEVAAYDWRIHSLSVAATPMLFLVYWALYSTQYTCYQGFQGAALTAPASALSLGLFFTTAIRWNAKN
ncbi:hypothetical protein [Nocardia sp. CA-120079]|uniref:hypothetical protein n=1 Tax=Nocardia sp. CA-120079 TaxID=3239974 RepID=UPI003D9784DF